jgi:hypothetical protein
VSRVRGRRVAAQKRRRVRDRQQRAEKFAARRDPAARERHVWPSFDELAEAGTAEQGEVVDHPVAPVHRLSVWPAELPLYPPPHGPDAYWDDGEDDRRR